MNPRPALEVSLQGSMERISISRGLEVDLQYQVISLAERLSLNFSGNTYTCLLLGHIETDVENATHRIVLNGLEPTTRKKFLENHDRCIGEVFVPFRISKTERNWKPLSADGMVAMMESVALFSHGNDVGDVASCLALFVSAVLDRQSSNSRAVWGLTRLEVVALLPGATAHAMKSVNFQLYPSPLADHLVGGMKNGGWSDARCGFTTVDDSSRRTVLLLSSDPHLTATSLTGVWLHGVQSVKDPAVWLWCQRFIRDPDLQRSCRLPHESFVLILFPTMAKFPIFYDVFLPLESSPDSLDFIILNAACNSAQIRDGLSLLALEPPNRQQLIDSFSVAKNRLEGENQAAVTEMYPRMAVTSQHLFSPPSHVMPEVPDISLLPDQSQIMTSVNTSIRENILTSSTRGTPTMMPLRENSMTSSIKSTPFMTPLHEATERDVRSSREMVSSSQRDRPVKKVKKTRKAKKLQVSDAGVQTSFLETCSEYLLDFESDNEDPYREFINQPRVYRLLKEQEAQLKQLQAQVETLLCDRKSLRDAGVATSLQTASSRCSMEDRNPEPSPGSQRFSCPSVYSSLDDVQPGHVDIQEPSGPCENVLDIPEMSVGGSTVDDVDSMKLGESVSMYQNTGVHPPMPYSMTSPRNRDFDCEDMIADINEILNQQSHSNSRQTSEPPSLPSPHSSSEPPVSAQLDNSFEINRLAHKYHVSNPTPATPNRPGLTMYGMHPSDITINTRHYMEKYGLLSSQQSILSSPRPLVEAELSGTCPAATLIKSDKLMKIPADLVEDGDSSDSSDALTNDTNFCLPDEDSLQVLAGYHRQPPLPVPSTLLRDSKVEGRGTGSSIRSSQSSDGGVRVLDLEKIRQTPKLL